jgi:hypothetical protein
VKKVVSPLTWTFEPSGFLRIRLWGAWLSWLSKVRVKGLLADSWSVVGWKPAVAAPIGAVITSPLVAPDGAALVPADDADEADTEAPADGAVEADAAGLPAGAPDAAPDAAGEADAAGA